MQKLPTPLLKLSLYTMFLVEIPNWSPRSRLERPTADML
jgi:hypothetical protein